jgi:hypothetical protein
MLWIKTEQTKFLPVELAYLTNGKGSGPSLVSQLVLFLDRERVVRCSGRLRYAHLSKETKHPIFIPRQSLLTPLIIRAYHERNFHSGPGNTVNNIRQCYWINCALSVKLALRGCTFWRREDGSPYIAPDNAALPDFRVTPSFPFLHCYWYRLHFSLHRSYRQRRHQGLHQSFYVCCLESNTSRSANRLVCKGINLCMVAFGSGWWPSSSPT